MSLGFEFVFYWLFGNRIWDGVLCIWVLLEVYLGIRYVREGEKENWVEGEV